MELIPEDDDVSERRTHEIEVRIVEAPASPTWCFICGVPIEPRPGPGLFLQGGWERVCKTCGRVHSPIALNELKWRREDWEAQSNR